MQPARAAHTAVMARGLVLLLLAALLAAGLVLGWTRPDLLPAQARAAGPTYAQAYEQWDAALKAKRHDEALAIVDELLLFGQDVERYREDARGMRLLAQRRGAKGPEAAADRDLRWRVERCVARHPAREVGLAVGALALAMSGVLSIVRRPRRREPLEVLGPRPPLEKLTGGGFDP